MQGNLFDQPTGEELRDKAIESAIQHADRVIEEWSVRAYQFLLEFIKQNEILTAEDVRLASREKIEDPPDKRAWGGIILRAAKSGLITRIGYGKAKNPLAHCRPTAIWQKCIN